MKQLLLNHQVWDLKNSGPALPLQLVSFLNGLVGQKSVHKAFNSRRLHLVGIVRWTLHLMVEAAELYTAGETAKRNSARKRLDSEELDKLGDSTRASYSAALNTGWYSEAPNADAVAVGGDPGNPLLQACKTLLRRWVKHRQESKSRHPKRCMGEAIQCALGLTGVGPAPS